MMLIDMTPQFAVIAATMNWFLALSAAAFGLAVLRQNRRQRAVDARRVFRLQPAARV